MNEKNHEARPARNCGGGHWKAMSKDLHDWLKNHKLAVIFAIVIVVINVAYFVYRMIAAPGVPDGAPSLSLGQILDAPVHRPGVQQPELDVQLVRLLASLILVYSPLKLLLHTVLSFVVLAIAESRLGSRRTIIACLLPALVGTAGGLLVCTLLNSLAGQWHTISTIRMSLTPIVLVVGSLMAASEFSDYLWRRRIQLFGYSAICIAVLYSGNPGDYCILVAAIVGHIAGRLWHGPSTKIHWWHSTSFESRRIIAAICVILALGPVVALTSNHRAGALSTLAMFVTGGTVHTPQVLDCLHTVGNQACFNPYGLAHVALPGAILRSLLPTAALLIIAWGLYKGRRIAAWACIVMNSAVALFAFLYCFVSPLASGESLSSIVRHGVVLTFLTTSLPPLVFAIGVYVNRRFFTIKTKQPRIQAGIITIGASFVTACVAYVLLGYFNADSFKPHADVMMLIRDLPQRFLPIAFTDGAKVSFIPTTVPAMLLRQGVGPLFWIVVIIVMAGWMKESSVLNVESRRDAGRLVELGGESMSFMCTWEGNSYWFSHSGNSAIAYRVLHGIALTTTGPFGDPAEYQSDLGNFARFCVEHSWSPVFYGLHRPAREILVAQGYSSIQVGTEMVVDPRQWETRGKKWQDIRTAINKAKRSGITDVQSTFEETPRTIQSQIVSISEQWADTKALPEMKFTLGGLQELQDPRVRLLYAIDADDHVLGVTSWLPTWQSGHIIGWTLDFMRHSTDSPNGIMEFLIARMAERLRDEGETVFMSLSAAPLAGLDTSDEESSNIITHALQMVADIVEPAYGFRSLFFFKQKFQPQEEPIYICYSDSAKLVPIGLAVLQAYLPDMKASQTLDMLKSLRPE
jgi:lysylphosphatidylglycerol synthetase-like protein (DUF2156 family)